MPVPGNNELAAPFSPVPVPGDGEMVAPHSPVNGDELVLPYTPVSGNSVMPLPSSYDFGNDGLRNFAFVVRDALSSGTPASSGMPPSSGMPS